MEWQIVFRGEKMSDKKQIIRCAIYTRKSSEEGLEQDFNSLQAQWEACEAYVKSQKHEGWVLVEKHYDDGGYSGGTIERPALKELLADISNGQVNIIVVYKIDRLTRSLMDFSKIVEVLDKNNTSFVSITQHFNTTTSMGRLTLNMLLSFAQFEREVTGERIRDKYAASKQKGMWMGGKVPLGYYRKDKKIFPERTETPKINAIFEKYIELKSVHLLKEYLDNNKIMGRSGKGLSKGNIYHILSSRTYLGEVGHKGKWYNGLHEGIISQELFSKAQEILEENRIKDRSIENSKEPSLLAGKIFDDKGNYMSPYHSNSRKGKRYRYYLSQAVIRQEKEKIGVITKIAAGEIEDFVRKTIEKELCSERVFIQKMFEDFPVNVQKGIIDTSGKVRLAPQEIIDITSKIRVFEERVEITYYPAQLKEILLAHYEGRTPKNIVDKSERTIIKEIRIVVVENGEKIIIGAEAAANKNDILIKAMLKSYKWHKRLMGKEEFSIKELCEEEGITKRYVNKILGLSLLSPKITEKILNGTQPRDLTFEKLTSMKTTDWKQQEKLLNIPS